MYRNLIFKNQKQNFPLATQVVKERKKTKNGRPKN